MGGFITVRFALNSLESVLNKQAVLMLPIERFQLVVLGQDITRKGI